MNLFRVITLLLALVVMAGAIESQRIVAESPLNTIYNKCESNRVGVFCLGGKQHKTSFPGGQGCLKNKNCEVIVHAEVAIEVAVTEGTVIDWQFCLRESKSEDTYAALAIRDPKDSTKMRLLIIHNGEEAKVVAVDRRAQYSTTQLKKVAVIKEMSKFDSTPPMTCAMFTSPPVMKFSSGVEFDLFNNKMKLTVSGAIDGRRILLNTEEPVRLFKNFKSTSQTQEPSFSEFHNAIKEAQEQLTNGKSFSEVNELLNFFEQLPIVLMKMLNATEVQ